MFKVLDPGSLQLVSRYPYSSVVSFGGCGDNFMLVVLISSTLNNTNKTNKLIFSTTKIKVKSLIVKRNCNIQFVITITFIEITNTMSGLFKFEISSAVLTFFFHRQTVKKSCMFQSCHPMSLQCNLVFSLKIQPIWFSRLAS